MRFYKDVADGAGSHVIFSGQTFYGAQSQNCETRKTHACPPRKTGGGSGEVEINNYSTISMKKFITNFLCPSLVTSAFLLAGLVDSNAQSQSNQITTNVLPQGVKAYKTLNFGDKTENVVKKIAEIIGVENANDYAEPDIYSSETFWRSLFDTDAECESYQSEKLESLKNYFKPLGTAIHSGENSTISVDCYQLYDSVPPGTGCLAVVKVSYKTFESGKLVDGFKQNYPNSRNSNKPYRFENAKYPGIFIEFQRTIFSDINPDRRATLSLPSEKFTFVFTDPSKLSKAQLAVWEGLMTQDGKTSQLNEFFESVKTSFLELAKKINEYKPDQENANQHGGPNFSRLDSITYLGWPDSRYYESIIYGVPSAVFASKQILDPIVSDYRKSIEAEGQKEKAKLKKDADSSAGF